MASKDVAQNFTNDLIRALNKESGTRVAYNLSVDDSPTHVKRWISTGSRLLDYIVSNRRNGGLPEGRIVEIFGPPSIGKSHIATQIARSTQRMGGIVVYIDTENATSVENLAMLGVDVSKRFVYIDENCTENVFKHAESTIEKSRSMQKDIPVTIIWDSIAASSPKEEIEGDYDKNLMGVQARALSKGFRKITNVIGNQSVLLVCLNQTRTKIGVMYGDPTTTPGGAALRFHASTRLKLSSGKPIKDSKTDESIGINVTAKTIKNKVAMPFRNASFQIHFGIGIKEHEEIFDILRKFCADDDVDDGFIDAGSALVKIAGTGAWKTMSVTDKDSGEVLHEKKFYKSDFHEILDDEVLGPYVEDLLEVVMIRKINIDEVDIDAESFSEVQALTDELERFDE